MKAIHKQIQNQKSSKNNKIYEISQNCLEKINRDVMKTVATVKHKLYS